MGEWMGAAGAAKPSPFIGVKDKPRAAPPGPAEPPAEVAIPIEGLDDVPPDVEGTRPKRARTAAPTAAPAAARAAAPAAAAPAAAPQARERNKERKKPGPKPGSKRGKSPMTDDPGLKTAEPAAVAKMREENARLRAQVAAQQPMHAAGDQSVQVQLAIAQTKNKAAAAMMQLLMRQQGMGVGPSDCSTPGSGSSSQTPITNPFLSFFTDDA